MRLLSDRGDTSRDVMVLNKKAGVIMKTARMLLGVLSLLVVLTASGVEPLEVLPEMKIREVTVFKDGHAFVLHRGKMPVTVSGDVVLDYLPAPVLGTYWPFSADEEAELKAVTAGRHRVMVGKTALTIREMIEGNIGASVVVTEKPLADDAGGSTFYEDVIESVPTRSGAELARLAPPASGEVLPQKGSIVMLRTVKGLKAVDINRIADVTFADKCEGTLHEEEFRDRLTLDLKWKKKQRDTVDVGMSYLQRGIRWIPAYRVELMPDNRVVVKLEASLINELADIENVTVNLVVGVPSFAFSDSVDPISLKQHVAQLTSHFQQNSQTAYAFSNAIMSQRAMPARGTNRSAAGGGASMDLGPELSGSHKSEDLYIFTIENISLRKGERMVMPIAEYEFDYKDIYAVDIPFTPPADVLRNLGSSQRRDLVKMFHSPKVKHKLRIKNSGEHPLTTAPAMIVKNGRIIAQGMMTYTPVDGDVDIELTTAVDISVKKTDKETKRTPNAVVWSGDNYARIDLEGSISLFNYKKESVTVEVTRYVLGNLGEVGQNGKKEMANPFENRNYMPDEQTSSWWYNYSWPWWWYRHNGIGKVTWETQLKPGAEADHTYSWHYFWR